MAGRLYTAGIVITGDAKAGIRSIRNTGKELKNLERVQRQGIIVAKNYGDTFRNISRSLNTGNKPVAKGI